MPGTLANYLREYTPTFADSLRIAAQLAKALTETHTSGVLVQGFEPSRILIDPDTLECSLAEADEPTSVKPWSRASLPYIAPEQSGRMRRGVDTRSDLYSLGVVLYQLFTGQLPFAGADPLELIHAHMSIVPNSPEKLQPDIAPVLAELVMTLLEKSPDDRYQSAEGLHRDLSALADRFARTSSLEGAVLNGLETSDRLRIPDRLYGREAEQAAILEAVTHVREGRPRCVLVSGAAGIGKTALVSEVRKSFARDGYFVSGKFDQFRRDIPYSAIRQAFSALVQQLMTESDERLDERRVRVTESLGPIAAVMVDIAPQLELLIGPQPEVPLLGPVETQKRLAVACGRFLDAVATGEHSLVLFVDDLQWADTGSLRLLEALVNQSRARLLVIGSYRATERASSSNLEDTLERLRDTAADLVELTLQPLTSDDLEQLLADTLARPRDECRPLAGLVARKTDSTPLLVRQFLGHAHDLGLFSRGPGDKAWRWRLDELEGAGIPDDVVGMMTAKIEHLPAAARALLARASCIGNGFTLPTLMALSEAGDDEHDTLGGLGILWQQGLVAASQDEYHFVHDKIHEAAYQSWDESQRLEQHLAIGRHWLRSARESGSNADIYTGDKLFAIADQLNEAASLITDPDERLDLAELDLHAAQRAMRSAAYGPACGYADAGVALLGESAWDENYELAFLLHLAHAESEFLLGRHDSAESRFMALAGRRLEGSDELDVAARVARLYNIVGRHDDAVRIGLGALQRHGVKLVAKPSKGSVLRQMLATRLAMAGKSDDDLLDLPKAESAVYLAQMRVIHELVASAYFTSANLFVCLTFTGVRLLLKHGVAPQSALSVACLAMFNIGLGQFEAGQRFMSVARRMCSKHDEGLAHNVLHVVYHMGDPWFVDVREIDRPMRDVRQLCLEAGDFETGSYVDTARVQNLLFHGVDLEEMIREVKGVYDLFGTVVPASREMVLHFQRVVEALRADQIPGDTALPELGALPFADNQTVHNVRSNNSLFFFALMGRWREAFEIAESLAPKVEEGLFALPDLRVYYLMRALAAASLSGAASGPEKRRYRKIVAQQRRKLLRWSRHSEAHAPQYVALIEAESARLQGDIDEAMRAYARAAQHAAAEACHPLHILADERRGTLALEQGFCDDAATFLERARAASLAWGARAKARQLEAAYPELIAREAADEAESAVRDESGRSGERAELGGDLDVETVVRAARAISEEVTLARVLERVMRGAIENAGAERGVLVLDKDGSPRVVAESAVGAEFVHHPWVPMNECAEIVPLSLIRYVVRTDSSVILDDANAEGMFTEDPYVAQVQARSILCVPIRKQNRAVGAFYVENRLVSDAFTEERLVLLRTLAAQASISMDNAQLYEELAALNRDLEERVERRTEELAAINERLRDEIAERKRAQEELIALQKTLVDTARAAGMADIASGVLHNVGNSLNSVNVSVSLMEEQLRKSKLSALREVMALVDQHADDLGDFLTSDPRGSKVMPFIHRLVTHLGEERSTALAEIEALCSHIGRIKTIVAKQQQYAVSGGEPESCTIREIVDDALDLSRNSLSRNGIAVEFEPSDTPRVMVDRHKVLQILVNLLSNAEQALTEAQCEDKRVVISTNADGAGRVQVRVRDNGVGIASENLARLFTHGFTTKRTGHGLGLHNSFLAARSMRATLRGESDGPGLGATFTLDVPAADGDRI